MQFNFLTFASLAVLAARSFADPFHRRHSSQCHSMQGEHYLLGRRHRSIYDRKYSLYQHDVLKDNSADAFLTVSDIQFTQISLVLPNTGAGETVLFKVNDSQGLTADTAFIAIGAGSNDTTCFAPALA
ncbi:hypothetical protein ABKN59_010591 [Abortiporus biennis]